MRIFSMIVICTRQRHMYTQIPRPSLANNNDSVTVSPIYHVKHVTAISTLYFPFLVATDHVNNIEYCCLCNTLRRFSSVRRGMLFACGVHEYQWLSVYHSGGREVNVS